MSMRRSSDASTGRESSRAFNVWEMVTSSSAMRALLRRPAALAISVRRFDGVSDCATAVACNAPETTFAMSCTAALRSALERTIGSASEWICTIFAADSRARCWMSRLPSSSTATTINAPPASQVAMLKPRGLYDVCGMVGLPASRQRPLFFVAAVRKTTCQQARYV